MELIPGMNDGVRWGTQMGKLFAGVTALVTRPMILLTRAIFRQDLGERYCGVNHIGGAGILIIGATVGTYLIDFTGLNRAGGFQQRAASNPHGDVAVAGIVFGSIWLVLLGLGMADHLWRVRRRYTTPQTVLWHSYCSGVPRGGPQVENGLRLLGVLLLVGCFIGGLYFFGILLTVSLYFSFMEDQQVAAAFWARVLDAIDAEIEAKHLGEAIQHRKTPADVEGLQAPMPAFVSGAFRERVAATVKGTRASAEVEAKPAMTYSPSTTSGESAL